MPYKDKDSFVAKSNHSKRSKKYYYKNKESILMKNKTEKNRIKSLRINNWKRRGLVELDGVYTFDSLYDYYLEINNCEVCDIILTTKNKCMDHCHTTGLFRWILCRNCNNFDNHFNLI